MHIRLGFEPMWKMSFLETSYKWYVHRFRCRACFRDGISDCPARDDLAMGQNSTKPWKAQLCPPSYIHAASALSPGGPSYDGSLLRGVLPALSRRPALMSNFRVCRATGFFARRRLSQSIKSDGGSQCAPSTSEHASPVRNLSHDPNAGTSSTSPSHKFHLIEGPFVTEERIETKTKSPAPR
jgi:hypothetical protein